MKSIRHKTYLPDYTNALQSSIHTRSVAAWLPMTASGVAQQGTCRNYAAAEHSQNKSRKRGGRPVKRQQEMWKERCSLIRVGTLNTGCQESSRSIFKFNVIQKLQ